MIDVKLLYQLSFFLDAQDITPSPKTVLALVDQLKEHNFISSTFNEIIPPVLHPQPRLRLITLDEEWNIPIGSKKVDVKKSPLDMKGDNLGELEDFCSKAKLFYSKIIEKYDKKAHRLALITSYMLEQMPEEKLVGIGNALLEQPPFYDANPPFEWDWRLASRANIEIVGQSEPANIIAALKRAKGDFQVKDQSVQFDRILFTLDINTAPENTESRFGFQQIDEFVSSARKLHGEILGQILDFVNV